MPSKIVPMLPPHKEKYLIKSIITLCGLYLAVDVPESKVKYILNKVLFACVPDDKTKKGAYIPLPDTEKDKLNNLLIKWVLRELDGMVDIYDTWYEQVFDGENNMVIIFKTD